MAPAHHASALTAFCNSGVKWLYIGRKKVNGADLTQWAELEQAAAFYRTLRDADPGLAVENPVMH